MLSLKSKYKIVATILAKNEEDIIAQNIEHHLEHGVTQFIITDNNSSDNTKKIAENYPEVVEIIEEKGDTHNQSEWVSRMARTACKLNPEWIVHLDADEFWCGLPQLRNIQTKAIGSTRMFLHPPVQKLECFDKKKMRYYLNFDKTSLDDECKVAHRPDPEIEITHGNHGFKKDVSLYYTKQIYRHHYPIRSYAQFEKKSVEGHLALQKRNAPCERWMRWYELWKTGDLAQLYESVVQSWEQFIDKPNKSDLINLLSTWSTKEVLSHFENTDELPEVGEWPKLTI